jgi:DNA repair exonuclease SbcCD nuclease subunit
MCQIPSCDGILFIVIAGDLFHTKSIIHSLAQSMLLDYVKRYEGKIRFIIIDGNHDMSSKSGDGVSSLKCLDNAPNVEMIHTATDIENIAFIPWNPKTMISDIKNSKADYLVSHFGLNEATLNSGLSIVSDIKLSDISHFKKCFVGHYHSPQEVGNVFVPGSIIQLDWGEKGEKKRFLIVDSLKHTIDSVEIQGYQRHVELEINSSNAVAILKQAEKLKENGDFVKLLKVDDIDISSFQKDFHVVDKTSRDITNRGINTSMSTEDKLRSYLKIKEIPEEYHEAYIAQAKNIIDLTIT